MLRRSPRSTTALDRKQQELAQEESDLRSEVAKLEQMIADAPRLAEETSRRQREELLMRANEGGHRLDVSIGMRDRRFGDERYAEKPRGALRKERREGRIVFIVLVAALAVVVIWLLTHLHL
jgi:hypothetical protein